MEPHSPFAASPPLPRAARSRRRGSCLGCTGLLLFVALMLPVFLCGLSLVLYLVFPPAPLDIIVMGVDARPGEGMTARADSVLLLGLQPARLRVSMLSIPRDLYIDVPGYGLQRLYAVNVLGEQEQAGSGPALMTAAIEASFRITPDRTIRLDFQGFMDLVDAVDGVTIDVPKTIVDSAYPTPDGGTISIRFDPGQQHMDGERALMYARTRHGDDDYQRAARQQQVISALSLRLLNPLTWPRVVSVLNGSVDTNLTPWDMISHAPTVLLNAGRFERLVIDRDLITATAGGQPIPDYAKLAPWINERFD